MKLGRLAFLGLGVLLLLIVLRAAGLAEIWQAVRHIGLGGMPIVLLLYAFGFWVDVASWHVVLDRLPFTALWSLRLYAIRLIGEAYNNATPLASIGGEPVKAWLLQRRHGIPLREAAGSLVMAKSVIVTSLVPFAAIGCLLLVGDARLGPRYGLPAVAGLAILVLFAGAFFLMQRLKLSSGIARRIGGTAIGHRLSRLVVVAEDLDGRFLRFYSEHCRRALLATTIAFCAWLFGVAEIYLVLQLLGHPVAWTESWIIEALVQTARTVGFMVPASIGTQEAVLFLLCGAVTGSPPVGVAVALVRRGRDLIWIALGLLLASAFAVPAEARRSGKLGSE